MLGNSGKRAGFWLAGVFLLLAPDTVRADDKEMQELRKRVEALEQQNQRLMKMIENGQVPPAPAPSIVQPAPQPSPATIGESQGQGPEGDVRKIIGDYMKEQDEQKKKEEEEKKKIAEEMGFEVGKDLNMKASWNYGLQGETADKAFRIHVGGRTQFDGAWIAATEEVQFGPGGIGNVQDAVNFRRARLEVDGTMYEVIDFWCEYDFLNTFTVNPPGGTAGTLNTPVPTDLWAQFTHLPYIGNVRAGNQKPFFGFEHLTSSRFLNFMERSLGFDAFVENQDNGFEPGIQMFNWSENERFWWGTGVFKHTRSIFGWNQGDGEYAVVGRTTCVPIWEEDGRCFLHLGLSGRYADADDDQARYRTRILVRDGPAALHNIVAEARMLADGDYRLNPELVLQSGPFLLQTEYTSVWTQNVAAPINPPAARRLLGSAFWQAYYIEALYFLTGEHRAYNRKYPALGRVVPNQNFYFVRGVDGNIFARGAWQVGIRYSYIDLQDKNINGGAQSNGATINDVTLGLNWFLNPNMKVQWNYSWAYREANGNSSNGPINAFGTRLAFDF